MNEPSPSNKSELSPFEKLQKFTQQVLSVPKTELDRRETAWRQEQVQAKERKGIDKKP